MNNLIKKYKNTTPVTKASIAYIFCVFLQKGIQVITWPVFTRLLSLEQYGQYTIYVAWVEIASIFLTLNLSVGLFPKAMEIYNDRRERYIATCQTIGAMLSIMVALLLLLFYSRIEHILGLPMIIMLVLIINVFTYLPIQLWESKNRYQNEYAKVVVVTALYTVISPIISLFFVLLSEDKGVAMIIGTVITPTLMGLGFLVYNYITSKCIFDKDLFVFAVSSHMPLVAFFLSQTILNQSDRIMINYYCGNDKAAIYGVSYSLAMIITLASGALNNSFIPFLYRGIKEKRDADIRRRATVNYVVIAMFIICIVYFAPEVILFVGGRKYMDAIWVIPPVAGSVLMLYAAQLFVNVQLYFEKKRSIALISVFVTLINVLLNMICIPRWGYYAAGYTTFASYMIYGILSYSAYKRIIKENDVSELYNSFDFIKVCGGVIILAIPGMLTYNYLVLRIVIFAGMLVTAYLINRKYGLITFNDKEKLA